MDINNIIDAIIALVKGLYDAYEKILDLVEGLNASEE